MTGAPGAPAGITAAESAEAPPGPAAFFAVTMKVYGVPFVRLRTVHERAAVRHAKPPGEEVTSYSVIGEPPFEVGAAQATVTRPSPPSVPVTTGASGTVAGVTEFETADDAPVPTPFVAVTVNEYGVPFDRPSTTHDAETAAHVRPPGAAVTVYPAIDEPPSETGADHDTVTTPLPADTDAIVGAPGTVARGANGVTSADATEGEPVPAAVVAVTLNVYGVVASRPVTTHDDEADVHVRPPGAAVTV